MNHQIDFEDSLYGTRAIIKSAWKDSYLQILLDKEVKELELNIGKGWRSGSSNIDFLKFLPKLEALVVLDQTIKSIEAIHNLTKLRSVNISTYCKTPVNFNYFPNLQDCFFEWRKGSDSLFDCKNLKDLGINKYDKRTSDFFSKLITLEKLTILNSKVHNLTGIYKLRKLKYLRMGNLKSLITLQGIESLEHLEELEIQRCRRIDIIFDAFKLKKIKRLLLLDLGHISSIKGIENLKELKTFLFYESTNIEDGDLTPIVSLKNLSRIAFQNRKHYSHTREDFGNRYS